MKKTPLKRGTSRLKRTPLAGGKVRLKRTRLKFSVAKTPDNFNGRDGGERCEECVRIDHPEMLKWDRCPDAHHLCSRARAPGHPMLHDKRNRAWLCREHHTAAHEGKLPEYIKSRDYLDSLS